ncbi:MAG: glycosyl hydrolase family 95 catalytic domain-containing protein [Armatimonadota bacterium]
MAINNPQLNTQDSPHTIRYQRPPRAWQDGFPLGNGVLGAMVWGDGAPLAFTLDHAELWDLRGDRGFRESPDYTYATLRKLVAEGRFTEAREIFEDREARENPVGPTKVSIGRAELMLGKACAYRCVLDIDTAIVSGTIDTETDSYALTAFVHRQRNLLCLRIDGLPESAEMRLLPLATLCEGLAPLHHPDPLRQQAGEVQLLAQEIQEGLCYALAWNPHGEEIYLAVEIAPSREEALARAQATWVAGKAVGFQALAEEHRATWREFWSASAVMLPEPEMEFLWYYGIYLLASSAQRGSTPPGLQGLWAMDGVVPPWRGDYHADMNVQETFWPACASGHLELLDCWCDEMFANLPRAREFTRRFFGTEGAFWPCCTLPRFTPVPCWATAQFGWSHTGWLGWLVWLRWRYSRDVAWLAEIGYPIIKEIFTFYQANLEAGDDGYLHIPLSSSPEYGSDDPVAWARDPNVDLALIRRCCDWLLEMETALGTDDLSGAAREVHARLAPYALTEGGVLCLWLGKPLDSSHRHPSHLMAIHPAMDLTPEDGEETWAVIRASVEQYLSLGQWQWAGHTYAQLISFAAFLRRSGWAYECLRQFHAHWIGPNSLHVNADLDDCGMSQFRVHSYTSAQQPPPFTMESNCAVSAGISDMLVQGWGDSLRIFPAVPAHWQHVAFHDLHTEGAFRVSAVRLNGETTWVRIIAGVDSQLRLQNPFGDAPVVVSDKRLHRDGDMFAMDLACGQEVVLHREDDTRSLADAIPIIRQSRVSKIGR